jgi:predicted nucleic acid-binding protein
MKVFVDANILVTVINKEYPLFPFTARILSRNGKDKFDIVTSPVCLAIAYYFAEKKHKAAAKKKLQVLSANIGIAPTDANAVRSAFADPTVKDVEDGLQYYSALQAGCDCILTEDKSDFYFSKIDVLDTRMFYEKHLSRGITGV